MDIYFGNRADDYYARRPLTLIDVGARGGLQPNWKPARRHLRVIGFEPDAAEYARLAADPDPSRPLYINAAVGREPGPLMLNVGREGGTSSILRANAEFLKRFPQPERYDAVRQARIEADTLDNLLARHDIHDADFIKIDTQGAELDILEGSRNTLDRSIFGLEVEVMFAPLYHGQPTFGAIDDILRGLGFQLFDLRPSYWKRRAGARYGGPKGQLIFGDVLYLRREKDFQRQLDSLDEKELRASKLLRALSVCLLYGYVDYAIELFEPNRDSLDKELADAVGIALRADVRVSTRLPHFRGRGWLSHFFYRLHRALFPTVEGWASGGRHIGNVE